MAGQTILDVMPKKDLEVLAEWARSGDPKAVAFLETCFALELKDTVVGTEQANPEMVLASFERALNLEQEGQGANTIMPSSRDQQAAAMALQASDRSL